MWSECVKKWNGDSEKVSAEWDILTVIEKLGLLLQLAGLLTLGLFDEVVLVDEAVD
jgi:hypothetical protein